MELETNIRLVQRGTRLYLNVREAIIAGTDLSPDIVGRACRTLQFRRGVAAIPHPSHRDRILVAMSHPIKDMHLKETNWAVDIHDSGQPAQQYFWAKPEHRSIVTELIERALQANLATHTDLWTMDSPRIWYEQSPFRRENGIAAYRRYTIGAIDIDDVGVGIVTEVSTAFFTEYSLAYFFAENVSKEEQEKRQTQFQRLTSRQKGKKGTLLYSIADHHGKCYFDDAPAGKTCGTTGEMRIGGQPFDSLVAYYKYKYPDYSCDPHSRAIRASFPGQTRPSWVSAECVFVRVMNDALPKLLKNVDKIKPHMRRRLNLRFWQTLRNHPLGRIAPGLEKGFWRPSAERVIQFDMPGLIYYGGQHLPAPSIASVETYKTYFKTKQAMLDELGCYDSPPTLPRVIHLAYPQGLSKEIALRFAEDLKARLNQLTRRPIQVAEPILYGVIDDAIATLNDRGAQIVVLVLNDDPLAYHKAAYDQKWHIKRVTHLSLKEHYEFITHKYYRWETYITMNALGILQLYNATPFALKCMGQYDAQLVIDVGNGRRNFALSLLIARDYGDPQFKAFTEVFIQPDSHHETINPIVLRDAILSLFRRVLEKNSDPLNSLLVLRDGEFRTLKDGTTILREEDGVMNAVAILKSEAKIQTNANIHLADFRKQTNKTVRFWLVDEAKNVSNALEGTAVLLNNHYIAVAATGAATLPGQGTPHPVVVTGNNTTPQIIQIARSVFCAAQLNWANPKVAQRLPQGVESADDRLQAREALEIKKVG